MIKPLAHHLKFLVTCVMLLAVMACTNLQTIRNAHIDGTDFSSYLAKGYQQYALSESELHQWSDANFFAGKAALAIRKQEVLPEQPFDKKWHLSDEQRSTFAAGREYFMTILDLRTNPNLAEDVAQAQVSYDCWLEKTEESNSNAGNDCRETFFELMDHLKQTLPSEVTAPTLSTQDVLEPLMTCTSILFDFNSALLNAKAVKNLNLFIHQLNDSERDHTLYIQGHADRFGSKSYNKRLATKRMSMVKNYIQDHIKGVQIDYQLKAYGEEHPRLPTADQMRESVNRRVDIGTGAPANGHCHPVD